MTPHELDALWAEVRPNPEGLVPCMVTDARSRAALMLAWVTKEALAQTLETGYATFWSRSQNALWEKGGTSGNRQKLVHVRLDCDGDTLIYIVDPEGPACHQGHDTCFTRRRVGGGWRWEPEFVLAPEAPGNPRILLELEHRLEMNYLVPDAAPGSKERAPLDGGNAQARARLREASEAAAHALGAHEADRATESVAKLLYNLALALRTRHIPMARVFEAIERRLKSEDTEPNSL